MTLDEAIKHEEEVVKNQENNAKKYPRPDKNIKGSGKRYIAYIECAEEHRQLAEWLKELQAYRKIISELSEAMRWYDGCETCQGFREYSTHDFVDNVRGLVKQFEEVNADECE